MGWSCNAPLLALSLCACAPTFDWRQVSPEGLGITATFPCRPTGVSRSIQIGGQSAVMWLHACTVDGLTFAISSAQIHDVRAVGSVMAELSVSAARNLGAELGAGEPLQVPGMTPHAEARRYSMTGRRPDGSLAVEHMAVFARGSRAYQAFILGPQPSSEVVQTFFSGLRFDA